MSIKLLDLEPQRRDAILNAALKEFVLKGFDQASTNVIAKEAGISKALMFHYVNSKKDIFLFVYDYFTELLQSEYYEKIDFTEKDIFARLRQSYLLQIDLLMCYPSIIEIDKLSAVTKTDEINEALQKRANKRQEQCSDQIFDNIDETKFREDLDIEKCKQLILWANIGFTNQILADIKDSQSLGPDYWDIIKTLDGYFEELRKVFYA